MKTSVVVSVTLFGLLSCFMVATANAEDTQATSKDKENSDLQQRSFGHPDDPHNLLLSTQERAKQKESLFRVSPLAGLHETTDQAKQDLYDATHIKLGLAATHLFQWLSESRPDGDTWGNATDMDIFGTWELLDRGEPTQGQLYFALEARWDWGTTAPETLGGESLGSMNQTANTYRAYQPAVILRSLYWQRGSKKAGWIYRIGKINPDAIVATSAHLSPSTTFLSGAGVGSFVIAHPDFGLGVAARRYFGDRVALMGFLSDADADRKNFGDIGAGNFYKALELAVKVAPKTPKAGYSKATLWHTDGTKDGLPSNAQTGSEGWGYFLKHEQEMTDDGRVIVIIKYGQSFEESAIYEQMAGVYFLLYDATGLIRLKNDLFGVGYTWAQATESTARSETSVEAFYRFPLSTHVDMSLNYQSVINPALDHDNDHASVFSIRLRTTF